MLLLIDNVPGHPRALIMYNEINVISVPAITTSIQQSMDQGVLLIFSLTGLHFIRLWLLQIVIPLMELGKANSKLPGKDVPLRTFMIHEKKSKYQHNPHG